VTKTHRIRGAALLALLAASALAGAASAQDRWDWSRGGDDDRGAYRLVGPGVGDLVPELRATRRGQAFVLRNFDFNHDGIITHREARQANKAFLGVAGDDRAHFDWEHRGEHRDWSERRDLDEHRDYGERRDFDGQGQGGWDRQGMRGYHMRQGRYGAVFTLPDVLFTTGSASLIPGADAKLQPLAGYLRANRQVRLRIDGYTDSVGGVASNMVLSRARAQSVANALSAAGVDAGRFELVGHGPTGPVASNKTAEGRQLNRRVEVTLVGQQARGFN
jgi:outer membrane protein OmpA-like peptidoglycan-associated protein